MVEEKDREITQAVDDFLSSEFGYTQPQKETLEDDSPVFLDERPAYLKDNKKESKCPTFMNVDYEGPIVNLAEPIAYEDAKEIASALFKNQVVFVKLTQLNDIQAGRMIDFLTGVVYGINGDIQRVNREMFICTPENMEITDDLLNRF